MKHAAELRKLRSELTSEMNAASAAVAEVETALRELKIGFRAEVPCCNAGDSRIIWMRWRRHRGERGVVTVAATYSCPVTVEGGRVVTAEAAAAAEKLAADDPKRTRTLDVGAEQAELARGAEAEPVSWHVSPPRSRAETFPHIEQLLDALVTSGREELALMREQFRGAERLAAAARSARIGNESKMPTGQTQKTTAMQ